MNRILVLLVCALAMFSVAAGPVAHAAERTVCVEAAAAHAAEGDEGGSSDQGDSGKGMQHQHAGCHAHPYTPFHAGSELNGRVLAADAQRPSRAAMLVGAGSDPALRPPQA